MGSSKKTLTETEMELVQIKRELAQVKMEQDIVKNPPKGIRLSL